VLLQVRQEIHGTLLREEQPRAGTLAHVLLASVNEVALLVARSQDQEAAMKAGADAIDELLQRLFT